MARPFRGLADRFAPVTESIVANAVGSPIVAAYVTIGAVDTWLTDAAYARIAERASHEELAQVLDRIRSIKERHQTFFVPQAEFRLAESASSRRVTRRRVARTDWPLRSDERPRAETSAFFRYAFDEHTDVLDHADARIAALPGLRRLTPLRARYEALR